MNCVSREGLWEGYQAWKSRGTRELESQDIGKDGNFRISILRLMKASVYYKNLCCGSLNQFLILLLGYKE